MQATLFAFEDYKDYLRARLGQEPRGVFSRLAKAIHSQSAHISQVLRGQAHFSLEQGHGISMFLKHTEQECEYFLLLIQKARAASPQLVEFFRKQITKIQDSRFDLARRVEVKSRLETEDEFTYYSSWYIAAVHILITIPAYRTHEAIQAYLHIDRTLVDEILRFLVRCGLIAAEGDAFRVTQSRIHLNQDSPMVSAHHSQWRVKAIESAQRRSKQALHYSSAISVSANDVAAIKEILIAEINRLKAVIRDSPCEQAYCLNFDFFEI